MAQSHVLYAILTHQFAITVLSTNGPSTVCQDHSLTCHVAAVWFWNVALRIQGGMPCPRVPNARCATAVDHDTGCEAVAISMLDCEKLRLPAKARRSI